MSVASGTAVTGDGSLHVWEAMPHAGFANTPEDVEIGVEVRKFVTKHLGING